MEEGVFVGKADNAADRHNQHRWREHFVVLDHSVSVRRVHMVLMLAL